MKLRYVLVICVSILFALPARGELYKYIDTEGNIHFTDNETDVPAAQRTHMTTIKSVEDEKPKAAAEDQTGQALNPADESGQTATPEDALTQETNQEPELNPEANTEEQTISAPVDTGKKTASPKTTPAASTKQKGSNNAESSTKQTGGTWEAKLRGTADELTRTQDELNTTAAALQKEKEAISQLPTTFATPQQKNEYIDRLNTLNDNIDQYEKKRKAFQDKVNDFNAQVSH